MLLQSIAFLAYSVNGHGLPSHRLLGRVMVSMSEIWFLLLLILLAKGYTVTRARLRQVSAVKVYLIIVMETMKPNSAQSR